MNLDLTDEETAALLRELDGIIDGDRYFLSERIKPASDSQAETTRRALSGARNRCRARR
jgi:hypothetical protein